MQISSGLAGTGAASGLSVAAFEFNVRKKFAIIFAIFFVFYIFYDRP
jgi:hypothetical protein